MKFKTLLGAIAALALATPALAQTYPTKPVTFVSPTPPGGPMSNLGRVVGDQLEKVWGQPIIVDNKPGGGSLIGAQFVKRAAPDGYTLLIGADGITTFNLFNKAADFDPEKDLTPITIATSSWQRLNVNSKVQANNLQEFIALAKANPGKLNYAGVNLTGHLLDSLLFAQKAGIDITMIPYAGAAPMIQALLADDVQMLIMGSALDPHIKAGTVKVLAFTGPERDPALPDVPTLREQGIDQVAGFWFGFLAPPGTPAALTEKISADIRTVLALPEVRDRLKTMGQDVVASTPAEMSRRIAEDVAARTAVAKAANIEPQ